MAKQKRERAVRNLAQKYLSQLSGLVQQPGKLSAAQKDSWERNIEAWEKAINSTKDPQILEDRTAALGKRIGALQNAMGINQNQKKVNKAVRQGRATVPGHLGWFDAHKGSAQNAETREAKLASQDSSVVAAQPTGTPTLETNAATLAEFMDMEVPSPPATPTSVASSNDSDDSDDLAESRELFVARQKLNQQQAQVDREAFVAQQKLGLETAKNEFIQEEMSDMFEDTFDLGEEGDKDVAEIMSQAADYQRVINSDVPSESAEDATDLEFASEDEEYLQGLEDIAAKEFAEEERIAEAEAAANISPEDLEALQKFLDEDLPAKSEKMEGDLAKVKEQRRNSAGGVPISTSTVDDIIARSQKVYNAAEQTGVNAANTVANGSKNNNQPTELSNTTKVAIGFAALAVGAGVGMGVYAATQNIGASAGAGIAILMLAALATFAYQKWSADSKPASDMGMGSEVEQAAEVSVSEHP